MKQKCELKLGDRVHAYGTGVFTDNEPVVLIGYRGNSYWIAKSSCGTTGEVHQKQCRRLIKRSKEKRREWWLNLYIDAEFKGRTVFGYAYATKAEADQSAGFPDARSECVRVVEKRGEEE